MRRADRAASSRGLRAALCRLEVLVCQASSKAKGQERQGSFPVDRVPNTLRALGLFLPAVPVVREHGLGLERGLGLARLVRADLVLRAERLRLRVKRRVRHDLPVRLAGAAVSSIQRPKKAR
jgi:hypothetical protein